MFVNIDQITDSLSALASVHPFYGTSFLAFKQENLPVGETIENLVFTSVVNKVLFRHYKPMPNYKGFYSPFLTSDKSNKWQKNRYASTTLQRITADTFGNAFIHPKNTQTWGWKEDYISTLVSHLPNGKKIPAFHLAVWLFRQDVWHNEVTWEDLVSALFSKFNITTNEVENIFDTSPPEQIRFGWLQDEPVKLNEILNLVGYPLDSEVTGGAVLKSLSLTEIGPASHFVYEPAKRLNVITGDNSLGKSFLFDCTWWALTNNWIDDQPRPRTDTELGTPRIDAEIAGPKGIEQNISAKYDWKSQQWKTGKAKSVEAGLVIYSRYDGSFAIWDSMFNSPESTNNDDLRIIKLNRDELWNGLESTNRKTSLCNGIIRDWVSWQLSGQRYETEWSALKACLKMLSPSGESLSAGQPKRINVQDEREIPTIVMPYGSVALVHSSAGIQRIIGLAYTLVWAWHRHIRNAELLRKEPQRNLVLIVDEVEAHLHPRWQKTIAPALMNAVNSLSSFISPQIHIATHSPIVMASVETIFDENTDDFHHLKLVDREVVLEELTFHKRGTADSWLMSEAFDETVPRSNFGEEAIQDALDLQLVDEPSKTAVLEVDSRLRKYLGEMDEFWPRWTYFFKKHTSNKI